MPANRKLAKINRTMDRVDAYIARGMSGVYRVFVKRAKYKHWFELGEHGPTDAAFERAMIAGTVVWKPCVVDKMQLFSKKM